MRRDLSACNRSQVMLSKAKSAAGAEVEQHQVMIAPLSASDGYDRIFAIPQDSTRRALKFWRLAYTELTSVEGAVAIDYGSADMQGFSSSKSLGAGMRAN